MTYDLLSRFQYRQLLALHFNNEFVYRNEQGNRWPRAAWVKMIDTLVGLGFVDEHLRITQAGEDYLESKLRDTIEGRSA